MFNMGGEYKYSGSFMILELIRDQENICYVEYQGQLVKGGS